MSKLYIIHDDEDLIATVKANSKKEALDNFARNRVDNINFMQHVTRFSIDDSLFEEFYRDDSGPLFDYYTNEYQERIKSLDELEKKKYIHSWIVKNVNEFWSNKPQFAAEYLDEYNKNYEVNGEYTAEFSHEFLVDTFKKLIKRGDWFVGFKIVKIELEKENFLLIRDN